MMTPFKVVVKIFVLAMLFCGIGNGVFAQQVTVTFSTPTTIAAANVCAGAQDVNIYAFRVARSAGFFPNNIMSAVSFTMSGTATVTADVTQYQLWRGTGGGTGTLVATSATTSFAGLNETFGFATSNDYFITADIAATPTQGRTIIVSTMTNANITTSGPKNGNGTVAGGTQTILTPPGAISGSNALCAGTTSPLSNSVAGGTWSSSNPAAATVDVATGVVSAVAAGNTTITYANQCNSVTYLITVTSTDPGTIVGANDVCNGSTISLTDLTPGGAWSSSIPAVATVDGSGTVYGTSIGTSVISYTVTNICGSATAMHSVTVSNPPSPGIIQGPSTMCAGTFTILSNTVGGGAWSTSNGNAIVSGTGVLTAISAGAVVVSYTLTGVCGPISATKNITIFPVLNAGTINGPNNVCVGNNIFLTDNTAGGAWSSTNPTVATVDGLGMVTGVSSGVTTISYLVSSGCGSIAATHSVTVNPTPDPGTINGPAAICVGTFALLTNASPGGVWTSSNTNIATVDNAGLTYGVALGSANIIYTVTNVCGTLAAIHFITVSPSPDAGTISGPASVCVAANIQLSETVTGGAWSTSNGNASVTGSGLVTGIAAGIVDISYTSTTPCGSLATVHTVTVNPLADPGTISGPSSVCAGSTISLTDAVAGGAWSVAGLGVAGVDASGNVTGLSAGTAVISYSVTNICNTAAATYTVTVNPVPTVPAISGPSDVCLAATIHLDNAVTGGLWNTTSTTVSVVGSGSGIDVTGLSAGTALISYSVTNGFGCATTITTNINVNSLPVVAPITGVASGCVGAVASLSSTTPGGVWSSDDMSVATVDAVTGDVTGVATGTANISYTVTNVSGCATTEVIMYTINTIPAATPITGITTVCEGAVTTLFNTTPGGVWSNTTGNATVNATGDVTGIAAGIDDISYTVTNSCGSVFNVTTVTVNPAPVVAPITSLYTAVCAGNTVMLNESITGGAWSSGNPVVATVDASGVVTGVSVGSAVISYSLSNGFGCTTVQTINITVGSSMTPVAVLPASGAATLCHGNPVNLQVVSTGMLSGYQWLTGTTPIPGATNDVYVANLAGTYNVIVDNGTCSQTLGSVAVTLSPNPVIQFTAPNTLYTASYNSYQWYLDGVAIPGAVGSLIHTTGDGNYTVVVDDANGCTDTSAAYSIGIVGVSNTPVMQPVKIYPNPATAILHIDAAVKVNIAILGVDGKLLISQKDATEVDVRGLANGMYLIMVYGENNTLINTAKFAKSE